MDSQNVQDVWPAQNVLDAGKMSDQLMRFALPTAPPASGNIVIPQSICRIHKELRPLLSPIPEPYLYVCGSALVVFSPGLSAPISSPLNKRHKGRCRRRRINEDRKD